MNTKIDAEHQRYDAPTLHFFLYSITPRHHAISAVSWPTTLLLRFSFCLNYKTGVARARRVVKEKLRCSFWNPPRNIFRFQPLSIFSFFLLNFPVWIRFSRLHFLTKKIRIHWRHENRIIFFEIIFRTVPYIFRRELLRYRITSCKSIINFLKLGQP